jgi:hypothetical protein
MRRDLLLLVLLCTLPFSACATDPPVSIPPITARSTGDKPALSPEKIATRNNAVSLLYQLTEGEKNVSRLLIIKGNRVDVANLVKYISSTAAAASQQMVALAHADPTLNLHAVDLPAGEIAARSAIAKTKGHELLLDTGNNFEFALLLTQADALSYGYNLAQIAASNSADPIQQQTFTTLADTMKAQYQRVIAFIRTPAK